MTPFLRLNQFAALDSDSDCDEQAPRTQRNVAPPKKEAKNKKKTTKPETLATLQGAPTPTQLQSEYFVLVKRESYLFQRFINRKLWFAGYKELALFLNKQEFLLIRFGEHQDCWVHFRTKTLLRAKHRHSDNKVAYTLGMLYQNPLTLDTSGKSFKVDTSVLQNRDNEAYKLSKGEPIPSKHWELDGTKESLMQMNIAHVKFRKESNRDDFEKVTSDYRKLFTYPPCWFEYGCTNMRCKYLHPGHTVVTMPT